MAEPKVLVVVRGRTGGKPTLMNAPLARALVRMGRLEYVNPVDQENFMELQRRTKVITRAPRQRPVRRIVKGEQPAMESPDPDDQPDGGRQLGEEVTRPGQEGFGETVDPQESQDAEVERPGDEGSGGEKGTGSEEEEEEALDGDDEPQARASRRRRRSTTER